MRRKCKKCKCDYSILRIKKLYLGHGIWIKGYICKPCYRAEKSHNKWKFWETIANLYSESK